MLGELESWMGLIDGLWQSTICPRLSGQISKMTMTMMMMMMMDGDDDHDDGYDDDDIAEVEFQKSHNISKLHSKHIAKNFSIQFCIK